MDESINSWLKVHKDSKWSNARNCPRNHRPLWVLLYHNSPWIFTQTFDREVQLPCLFVYRKYFHLDFIPHFIMLIGIFYFFPRDFTDMNQAFDLSDFLTS